MNRITLFSLLAFVCLGCFFISSCKTKKIAENPIGKFLTSANPYSGIKADAMGFGDIEGGLRDSLNTCYELLDQNDKELRPIIAKLVDNNPENEELQFINGKNHMNLENY